MLSMTHFEMTDRTRRRRRPKVVPRAAADFVRQLKRKNRNILGGSPVVTSGCFILGDGQGFLMGYVKGGSLR